MPLTVRENGHHAQAWFDNRRDGATDTIAMLEARKAFGHFGKSGPIEETAGWRIDRQKNIAGTGDEPGKSNLQLQKNGVSRPSTMGCLIVPDAYFFGIDGPEAGNREAELTRIIRQGLISSLASWVPITEAGYTKRGAIVKVFEVCGEFSSPKPKFVSPQKPMK